MARDSSELEEFCRHPPHLRRQKTDTTQKSTPIPPLFKADSATLAFSASKDGKVNVNYAGWDAGKVVLEGQVFEVRWGPQGVEGRIVEGGRGEGGP
jgi:hypothetical protein